MAKTGNKKLSPARQTDTGSIGMGTWRTREDRLKGKGAGGKPSGRGRLRTIIPPPEGWQGGFSDKNGCRWRKGG
jgi:hypothetical protein